MQRVRSNKNATKLKLKGDYFLCLEDFKGQISGVNYKKNTQYHETEYRTLSTIERKYFSKQNALY